MEGDGAAERAGLENGERTFLNHRHHYISWLRHRQRAAKRCKPSANPHPAATQKDSRRLSATYPHQSVIAANGGTFACPAHRNKETSAGMGRTTLGYPPVSSPKPPLKERFRHEQQEDGSDLISQEITPSIHP